MTTSTFLDAVVAVNPNSAYASGVVVSKRATAVAESCLPIICTVYCPSTDQGATGQEATGQGLSRDVQFHDTCIRPCVASGLEIRISRDRLRTHRREDPTASSLSQKKPVNFICSSRGVRAAMERDRVRSGLVVLVSEQYYCYPSKNNSSLVSGQTSDTR